MSVSLFLSASEEAMTAVIWLGCTAQRQEDGEQPFFPDGRNTGCPWAFESYWAILHGSHFSLRSKLDLPIELRCFGFSVCIGFIGFDKLSSVCKIYLSNQAAEGAILLLHSIPRTLAATASSLRVWFATPPKHKTSWCPSKGSSY